MRKIKQEITEKEAFEIEDYFMKNYIFPKRVKRVFKDGTFIENTLTKSRFLTKLKMKYKGEIVIFKIEYGPNGGIKYFKIIEPETSDKVVS